MHLNSHSEFNNRSVHSVAINMHRQEKFQRLLYPRDDLDSWNIRILVSPNLPHEFCE